MVGPASPGGALAAIGEHGWLVKSDTAVINSILAFDALLPPYATIWH
jgi:hypothetical protein